MPDKTISFFFLGTACHRSAYQDVLTNFYDAASKHTVSRLFDGVGSSPVSLSDVAESHPTPGRYVYDPENDKKIPLNEKITKGINDLMQRLQGQLAGEGMDELLFEAILFLEKQIRDNGGEMPDTINLHGYSRGADACMRLANLLDSMYPDVKVNMFLIDHVPGPGRADDPSSYTIPRNVRKFESVLMLHEYTPGFMPQDKNRYVITNPEETKVSIKVYPGWHGKAMYLTPDEKTNHVPRLLHDDFFRFSKETGSLPKNAKIPNYKIMHTWTNYDESPAHILEPQERFKEYEGMLENWNSYSAGNWSLLNTRNILMDLRQYTQNKDLFVNQEHGELFMKGYPALYDWFFDGNDNKEITELKVKGELEELSKEFPFFYKRLCKVCGIHGDKLPAPGRAAPYFHPPLGNPLVGNNDYYSFLQHSVLSIINYTFHHKNENCLETRIATKVLRNGLEKAKANRSPAESTKIIENTILYASKYLSESKPESYMAQQLKKLASGVFFFEDVDRLLQLHCQKNRELHYTQKHYLQEIRKKLDAINSDPNFSHLQKLREAKAITKKVVKDMRQMEQDESVIVHKEMSLGLFFYSDKTLTTADLVLAINKLNAPGFGELSIAQRMARRFHAYNERNILWERVEKILSAVMPIKLPPFVSPIKRELSINLLNKLNQLEEEGNGDDVSKLSEIIAEGERSIQKHYSETRKLAKGDFDKILEKCRGYVWSEVTIGPVLNALR
ncbi:DUF5621 domain-containing protein [Legionella micdadei]|uniref:DUF5621 domain-containing protein n=2 Tax=Legionella micdadei TaxID=451 RepID=A0A098GI27_LEGMI|nr:DUF5621 domain-containing protein [Legionella micdadei]ARG97392.1 hypothetical protein B6N58_06785 [Legionella micdadei]KTD28281.1 Dot/Icm T4SS effector [Legionella micdadei]NSL16908.1 DUF5621 domain-containing protein [Legionella micdadei]CEG61131.1 conserved protein of unknown function [Legionella micdadei]SCY31047.1 hypothetical protein SAMN02982997_01343 [Legionella micdadei]